MITIVYYVSFPEDFLMLASSIKIFAAVVAVIIKQHFLLSTYVITYFT
jgi:hypothetical protein